MHTFGMNETSDLDWPSRLMLIAQAHGGYVTYRAAAEAGLTIGWLSSLTKRGVLERKGHGLYRISEWPVDEYDSLREAVLWARGQAVVGGETALHLWGLGEGVPRTVDLLITPPYRPRKVAPGAVRIRRRPRRFTSAEQVHAVPTLSTEEAIADAIEIGAPQRSLERAIEQALARELISKRAAAHLLVALDARK